MKRVTITRLDGHKVVGIRIPDGPVFELTLFMDGPNPDAVYERYVLVAAPDVREAKILGRPEVGDGEIIVATRKAENGEVALHVLNDGEIVGWKP